MKNDQSEYCVIDCRVSDPQQLKGDSLENQENLGRRFAEERGWKVEKVFKKPHSATTTERDDIEEIERFIKTSKNPIRHYVFKSIDRFTRVGSTEYEQRKERLERLGVQIWDTGGIIQPKKNTLAHLGDFKYRWSFYSPSEGAEMLAAHQGKQDWRDTINRLISAEIMLVQSGFAVRRAPDGLKNKPTFASGKEKVIREPDSDRAHYFQKMFKLLADGVGYQEVVDILNAMGFRTRTYHKWDRSDKENPKIIGERGGKLLTVKQLQRYVQQTEYAGVSYEKWNKHIPQRMKEFDGIVPIDVFNKANRGKIFIKEHDDGTIEILHNYSPWAKIKRRKDNPLYPWKCVLCPLCKSEMLASASAGKSGAKFGAYHCGGMKSGKRIHNYYRVSKEEFEKNVRTYLDSLKFEEGFLAGLELHLIDEYRNREKEILIESSAISRTVSDLKAELAQKLNALSLAQSPVVRALYEEEITSLDTQIKQAEGQRGQIEFSEKSIRAFRKYAEYVMEHPAEILTNAKDLYARRRLVSLFFEEIPTYEEILNGTPKLQPLFRLSEEFKRDKSQLVTLRGIEPRFWA